MLDAGVIYDYLSEWKDWNETSYDRWETWRRSTNTEVEKLAQAIGSKHADTRARVQAVADTVGERLEIVRDSARRRNSTRYG